MRISVDKLVVKILLVLLTTMLCLVTGCNEYTIRINNNNVSSARKISLSFTTSSQESVTVSGLSDRDRIYLLRGANASCQGGQDLAFAYAEQTSTKTFSVSHLKDNMSLRVLVHSDSERICSPALSYTFNNPFRPRLNTPFAPVFEEHSRISYRVKAQVRELPDPQFDSLNNVVLNSVPHSSLAPGNSHTCALTESGKILCWGYNDNGSLGDGSTTSSYTPVEVFGVMNAISVVSRDDHTCALLDTGKVVCWGYNDYGQLGNNSNINSSIPVEVNNLSDAVSISVARSHSCALVRNGEIKCWGANTQGRLGNNSTTDSWVAVTVSGITNAVSVSTSYSHSCAVLADGTARCWGGNYSGELGNGNTTSQLVPVPVNGLSNVLTIHPSNTNTCALLKDGKVMCWGNNYHQLFGIAGNISSLTPMETVQLPGIVSLKFSYYSACALLDTGSMKCWGSNDWGMLGANITSPSGSTFTPQDVYQISTGTEIAMGAVHHCALLEDQSVKCWGSNSSGELGAGPSGNSSSPVKVKFPRTQYTGIVTTPMMSSTISLSQNHHCFIQNNGQLKCWGLNSNGQLGNNTFQNSQTPVTVQGLTQVKEVSAGLEHTCAVLHSGEVYCWGRNNLGQLGNGTNTDASTPVLVQGISSAVAISTGDGHSCALLSSGEIDCWGDNQHGNLGNGDNTATTTPVAVQGITQAVAVKTGPNYSCALLQTGRVQCWGNNWYGQLGISSYSSESTPQFVNDISNAVGISLGTNASCAILGDGKVNCWGSNYNRLLGTTQNTSNGDIIEVENVSSAISVSVGYSHACALLSNGEISCWGSNGNFETGHSENVSPVLADKATGITGMRDLDVTGTFTCGINATSEFKCFGSNPFSNSTSVSRRLASNFDYSSMIASYVNMCFILPDKKVQCVGYSSGLGIGVSDPNKFYSLAETTPIPDLENVSKLYNVGSSFCAMTEDKKVFCWGHTTSAPLVEEQVLPNGETFKSFSAVSSAGVLVAVSSTNKIYMSYGPSSFFDFPFVVGSSPENLLVLGGGAGFCSNQTDGKMFCYGDNGDGQLGVDPSVKSYLNPAEESLGLAGVTSLTSSYSHNCWIAPPLNEINCVGTNYAGQFGLDPAVVSGSFMPTATGITGVAEILQGSGSLFFSFLKDHKLYTLSHQHASASLGLGDIKSITTSSVGGFYAVVGEEKSLVIFYPEGVSGSSENIFTGPTSASTEKIWTIK